VRIACAGGGPAGLYFAMLMKLWQPESEPTASTFIVECAPATWAGLGFDDGPASLALDRLEEIFGRHLDGHRLTSRFPDGSDGLR
jgi:hypothetical protein